MHEQESVRVVQFASSLLTLCLFSTGVFYGCRWADSSGDQSMPGGEGDGE